jgi:hypothetical protein
MMMCSSELRLLVSTAILKFVASGQRVCLGQLTGREVPGNRWSWHAVVYQLRC